MSSNVLECRVLDSLVLEVFPTQYSTRNDSIFVEEVRPSANSPKAGMFHKASVKLELQSPGLEKFTVSIDTVQATIVAKLGSFNKFD